MPRLIPPELGNGKRPSDPAHANGTVPVLDVSDEAHDLVGTLHDRALDPDDDTDLLAGAVVMVDNGRPADGSPAGPLTIHVGGSTLHEAATECVSCITELAGDMPEWVACTDDDLAAVLAEHFTVKGYSKCRAIAMGEVTS